MKVERSFQPELNRYDFDSTLLQLGYLQVDTEQDASYYGNWVNLTTKRFVQFAEGDVTFYQFDSDEELTAHMRCVYQLRHIDLGRNPDQHRDRVRQLSIEDICA